MKEYQSVKDKSRVLPGAVYHQCLWIVKDMDRLEEIAQAAFQEDMLAESAGYYESTAVVTASPEVEEAIFKLDCIHRALLIVPEDYREGVLQSIRERGAGYSAVAHENTWKKWKQRFIYALAQNLRLVGLR